tara:strand:- start:1500 stop:1694 length:195 start_codon:yes stop_codon:yes gene_type:complete
MIEPAELFARITGQFEDLHGIAVDGQGANLSNDEYEALVDLICTGLQRIDATLQSTKTLLRRKL